MRVGLFGGTFDPVHQGHLDVALAACTAMGLDRIVFMPSRVPSHKGTPGASAAHRFAMAALAIEDYPRMILSDEEMSSDTPSYTVDTLDRLASRGMDLSQVFFLVGADAFREIRTWKNFPGVLDRCHFVVVDRPGYPTAPLPDLLPELADRMTMGAPCAASDRPAIFLVQAPTAPVSATDVRERVAAGRSSSDLVPPAVAAYILKHRLYTDPSPKGFA